MDSLRFDSLARAFAAPTRRGFLRAALAAAGLAAASGEAAAACDSHADCGGCRKCNRKRGRCVEGCPGDTICRGRRCVRTCANAAECGTCETCSEGICVADPGKEGVPCGGCRKCGANGSCGVPDDGLCEGDQICRSSTGICCPVCVTGACCGVKEECIDPGTFSSNFCCDTRVNTPCGGGGGTFAECCSNRTEECCRGTCVRRGECRNHCANNSEYVVPCAEGRDEWCCPERSPVCCRDGDGDPHCCAA